MQTFFCYMVMDDRDDSIVQQNFNKPVSKFQNQYTRKAVKLITTIKEQTEQTHLCFTTLSKQTQDYYCYKIQN